MVVPLRSLVAWVAGVPARGGLGPGHVGVVAAGRRVEVGEHEARGHRALGHPARHVEGVAVVVGEGVGHLEVVVGGDLWIREGEHQPGPGVEGAGPLGPGGARGTGGPGGPGVTGAAGLAGGALGAGLAGGARGPGRALTGGDEDEREQKWDPTDRRHGASLGRRVSEAFQRACQICVAQRRGRQPSRNSQRALGKWPLPPLRDPPESGRVSPQRLAGLTGWPGNLRKTCGVRAGVRRKGGPARGRPTHALRGPAQAAGAGSAVTGPRRGSTTRTSVPDPERMLTSPPWRLTRLWTMAIPSPVPPGLVE